MNAARWKMFTDLERDTIADVLFLAEHHLRAQVFREKRKIAEKLIGEIRAASQEEGPTVAEAKAAGQLPGVVGYVARLPQEIEFKFWCFICNEWMLDRCAKHPEKSRSI